MRAAKLILRVLRGGGAKAAAQRLPYPFDVLSVPVPGAHANAVTQSGPERRGFLRRLFARLSWKWRVLVGLPLAGAALAAPTLAFFMVYYTVSFPHPLAMRNHERAPVIRILARDGSLLAERGAAHDYVPLDLLPKHVPGAVVAIEDRRFFEHNGLDPAGFVRAVFANLRAGRFAQGGSTLTQQLAKNLFLTPQRTFRRKLEELALALWLELRLSKSDILELYLNSVYFGAGAYGIEGASQRYFDKSARELTPAEAALIAGLLKAPSKYSPLSAPAAAKNRARIVLSKMVETGVITESEGARALAQPLVFSAAKPQQEASDVDYAVDYVLEQLPPLIGSGHAEIVVETTLDAKLQKRASEIVTNTLARQGAVMGVSQAALVLLDGDGGIRALVGGRNYAESQFNRAVKARRQPGSVFKPFVYLAALESGLTPDTRTFDLPLSIDGWAPKNDNGTYAGEVTLRRALAQSINTVAVRLNQQVGSGRAIEVARRLGIKSELREEPSLALGTSEVSLLEMTGAYGVFGNGGSTVDTHAIRRVRLSSGRVVFAREAPGAAQVVDAGDVAEMNDMLHTALTSGTGRRAQIASHPAAGKTGTSQEFRDAWFIGYTAQFTAGVWIGNDNGKPMNRAMGGGLPAEMWRELMTSAHADKPALPLSGVRDGNVAPALAATPPASRRMETEPARLAEVLPWQKLGTGAAAHPDTPIDGDFIDRALAQTQGDANGGATADPGVQAPEPPKARPSGMMSLGGWW